MAVVGLAAASPKRKVLMPLVEDGMNIRIELHRPEFCGY